MCKRVIDTSPWVGRIVRDIFSNIIDDQKIVGTTINRDDYDSMSGEHNNTKTRGIENKFQETITLN